MISLEVSDIALIAERRLGLRAVCAGILMLVAGLGISACAAGPVADASTSSEPVLIAENPAAGDTDLAPMTAEAEPARSDEDAPATEVTPSEDPAGEVAGATSDSTEGVGADSRSAAVLANETQPAQAVDQGGRREATSGERGRSLNLELPPLAFSPSLSSEAEAADVESLLTLSEALDRAWTSNPQVLQAELALHATKYDISGSRAGYYPYLAIQTEQSDSGDNSASIVRVVQPLWNGGLTGAQVDLAKAQQMRALAQLNGTRLDLGLRTAEAYLNVVMAQDMDRQWRVYVSALEELLEVIRRRGDQGMAPRSDEQTAKTRLSQARAGAEGNLAVLASNRAQLTSLIDAQPQSVAWPSDSRLLSDSEVAAAGRTGIAAHPQRQIAIASIKEQEATARANKASLWPEIALEHREQLNGFVVDPNNDNSTLLVLQYQTNSGLRGYRAYQAERERTKAARASLENAVRQVEASIAVARSERASASRQVEVQIAAARSASELVESFRRQFEVGRKSWLELLNAHREANELVLQSIAVKRSLWLANTRLALQSLLWRKLSDRAPNVDVVKED